jgi:hypothetical protein
MGNMLVAVAPHLQYFVLEKAMKSWVGTVLFSLGLIYFSCFGFIVWIKPKYYLKNVHERRLSLKSHSPFLPDWLIGFIFFYEQPQFSIWWARIVITMATLICVGGLIAAIHGPF